MRWGLSQGNSVTRVRRGECCVSGRCFFWGGIVSCWYYWWNVCQCDPLYLFIAFVSADLSALTVLLLSQWARVSWVMRRVFRSYADAVD